MRTYIQKVGEEPYLVAQTTYAEKETARALGLRWSPPGGPQGLWSKRVRDMRVEDVEAALPWTDVADVPLMEKALAWMRSLPSTQRRVPTSPTGILLYPEDGMVRAVAPFEANNFLRSIGMRFTGDTKGKFWGMPESSLATLSNKTLDAMIPLASDDLRPRLEALRGEAGRVGSDEGLLFYRQDGFIRARAARENESLLRRIGMKQDRDTHIWALPEGALPSLAGEVLDVMALHADAALKVDIERVVKQGKATEALSRAAAPARPLELAVPPGLKYKPYQEVGIAYGARRDAVLIADEMGLGKTIQAIGICNNSDAQSVLIICPASLRLNWAKEFLKWSTKPARVRVMSTSGDLETMGRDDAQVSVAIVNYDILSKMLDEVPSRFDLLIVDEAHLAKNEKALRSKGVRTLAERAQRKVFLTGTPILNRPIEIWNLLDILQPGAWGDYFAFGLRYADAKKGRFGWDFSGASNLDELQDRLRRGVMVRRLKMDVLKDLPPKIRQIVSLDVKIPKSLNVELPDRLARLWEIVQKSALLADKAAYAQATESLQKAMQINFTEASRLRQQFGVLKAPAVADYVEEMLEGGVQKIVVFGVHIEVLNIILEKLAKYNPVTIRGGVSMQDRNTAVERFQTDPSVRVFVGNIQAAGVGLTLTQASHVVFAELDWVPANLQQAEDRCHRIGQKDTVNVYHLVAENTYDSGFARILVDKMNIADAALDDATEINTGLRAQELEAAIVEEEDPGRYLPSKDAQEAARRELEELRRRTDPDTKKPGSAIPAMQATVEVVTRSFTPEQHEAIGLSLVLLAVLDDDLTAIENGLGFTGADGDFGRSALAVVRRGDVLDDKVATAVWQMLKKYGRKQLGDDVCAILFPEDAPVRKNGDFSLGLHDDPLWEW